MITILFVSLFSLIGQADSKNPYSTNSKDNAYGAGSAYSDQRNPYGRYLNPYSDDSPDNSYGKGLPSIPDDANSVDIE